MLDFELFREYDETVFLDERHYLEGLQPAYGKALDLVKELEAERDAALAVLAAIREELGEPHDWEDKLMELHMWTGTEWLSSGTSKADDLRSDLHSWLACTGGWLIAVVNAAKIAASAQAAEAYEARVRADEREKVYGEERDRLNRRIDATEVSCRGMKKTEGYYLRIDNLVSFRDYFGEKALEMERGEEKGGTFAKGEKP